MSDDKTRLIPFEERTPEQTKDLIGWCEARYVKCMRYRDPWERLWESNLLALVDKSQDAAAKDLNSWDRSIGRKQFRTPLVTANNILPLYRQAHSAVAGNLAITEAKAASNMPDDLYAAEVANDLLRWRDEVDEVDKRRKDLVSWILVTGVGYQWPWWNRDAVTVGLNGEPIKGLGDIEDTILSPWNVYLPPYSTCLDEPDYVIVADCHNIDEINEMYEPSTPVKAESVAQAEGRKDSLRSAIISGRNTPETRKDAAILKRLMVAPRKGYPNGRMIVWANDVLLFDGELPEKMMPVVRYDWLKVPMSLYGMSFIMPLVPLQRQINMTLTQQADMVTRNLRQDFILRGTGMPREEWMEAQGDAPWNMYQDPRTGSKVIYLDSTIQEFSPVHYKANYREADLFISSLWNQMMRIAGLHEPSIGERVAATTTATTVLTLKQSDESGMSVIRQGIDEQLALADKTKLTLLKEHVAAPRIAKVTNAGPDKTRFFIGSDIRSISDVSYRSAPIIDRITDLQLREKASAMGLFGPYQDPLDMLSKFRMLINIGIPDIRQEIDSWLAPQTYEELEQMCGAIYRQRAQTAMLIAKAELDQTAMAMMQQEMQAQAMMSGGMQQGQPEQGLQQPPMAQDVGQQAV